MQAPPDLPAGLGRAKEDWMFFTSAEVCASCEPEIMRTEAGIAFWAWVANFCDFFLALNSAAPPPPPPPPDRFPSFVGVDDDSFFLGCLPLVVLPLVDLRFGCLLFPSLPCGPLDD